MELGRTSIGLISAVSVPAALGWLKKDPWWGVLFTLLYAGVVILPESRDIHAWLVLLGVTLISVFGAVFNRPWTSLSIDFSWLPAMSPVRYAAVAGVVASSFLLTYIGWGAGLDHLREVVVDDDRFMVTASGLLLAVFGFQFLISFAVDPLVNKIDAEIAAGRLLASVRKFVEVGSHVGWIERLILFSFLVSGSPEAAALVVTAKSFARAPEVREGGRLIGDYYLIGTLVSVAAALGVSVITRLGLGLSPF
ncbi:hypothetical protein ACIOHO_08155 [Streptomyces sp. NPDC087849]|uniref:hypothetical protein n=1 Tax=unclassified Streptomyces TaxID=2593676 RepID=UPI0038072976